MGRRRALVNFVLAVVLLTLECVAIDARVGMRFSDFPSYYATAHQVVDGTAAAVYVREQQRAVARKYFEQGQTDEFEPPYAVLWTTPLAGFEPMVAKCLFSGVLICALAAAAVMLAEMASLSGRAALVLLAGMVVAGPTFELLTVSKLTPIVLLGLVLALRMRDSKVKSGLCLGLCLLRPQEALPFLVYSLGAGKLRFTATCVGAGALLVLLSLPIFGQAGYINWLNRLNEVTTNPSLVGAQYMPILKGQLLLSGVDVTIANTIATGAYVLTLVLLAYLGYRRRHSSDWWKSGVITAFALGLTFVPYMHLYDTILLMPVFCMLLLSPLPRAARALVILDLLLFLTPVAQLLHEQVLTAHIAFNPHFAAIALLAAIALYAEFAADNHDPATLGGD